MEVRNVGEWAAMVEGSQGLLYSIYVNTPHINLGTHGIDSNVPKRTQPKNQKVVKPAKFIVTMTSS